MIQLKGFMLIILIALTLFTSTTVHANEYCYDRAVMAVDHFKESILNCDSSLDVEPINALENSLSSFLVGYGARVVNKMSKVYTHLYTSLPYGKVGDKEIPTEVKKCVEKLGYGEFDQVKAKVMDALVMCRI